MAIADLMRDTISIFDGNGELVKSNEKASVQGGNSIITLNGDYPVDIGYFIERNTSNGIVERYKVIEPNFSPGLRMIKAHYQMKVINVKAIPDPRTASTVNTINASGNARVYQNSVDNSTNTYTVADYQKALSRVNEDILGLDLDDADKALTSVAINKISEEIDTGKLNKDKMEAYISMLPVVVSGLESVVRLAAMVGLG